MKNALSLTLVKEHLGIKTTDKDTLLKALCVSATAIIQGIIHRKLITEQKLEYPNDWVKNTIYLESSPVFSSSFAIYSDHERLFPAGSLVPASDYLIDEEGAKVLFLNPVPQTKDTLKVDYYSGLSRFAVLTGLNDSVTFDDSAGEVVITFTGGEYISSTIATEIETVLNASALNGAYTVTFNEQDLRFTISCDETFEIHFSNGVTAGRIFGGLIGFDILDDKAGETAYTSDFEVSGVSSELQVAGAMIVSKLFNDSVAGTGLQNVTRRQLGQDNDVSYGADQIPSAVSAILDQYIFRRM